MIESFNFPLFNAVMNGLGFLCLLVGVIFVKKGQVQKHRAMMMLALLCSAIFLTSYLIYHFNVGHVVYTGNFKSIYIPILISHTILSVVLLPLIYLAIKAIVQENIDNHKKWVKFTLPVWMYVNLTGVLIYLFNS